MHRDTSYVSYFSSNGPAADGRLKPELVAPGNVAVSAASAGYSGASSCGVVGMSGTSMATPAAAGMEDCPFSHLLDAPFLFFFLVLAAVDVLISNYHLLITHRPGAAMLVRQYLSGSAANGVGAASSVFAAHQLAVAQSLGWNTCLPGYACGGLALATGSEGGGALVKALLVHGAAAMAAWDRMDLDSGESLFQTLDSPPPDMSQGFGRVTLDATLLSAATTPAAAASSAKGGLWARPAESVASGETVAFRFRVVSAAVPLKATLCWFDPENSVAAGRQLLNDLDLTIKDESAGVTYYANGGSALALDELNPLERVVIDTPQTADGDYTVAVSASALSGGAAAQTFALVVSGACYFVDPSTTWELLQKAPSLAPTQSQRPTNPPTLLPTPRPSVTAHPTEPPSRLPTHGPTVAPAPQPTAPPNNHRLDDDDDRSSAATVVVLIAVASVILIFVACGIICALRCRAGGRPRHQRGSGGGGGGGGGGDAVRREYGLAPLPVAQPTSHYHHQKVMIRVPEGAGPGDQLQASHPAYPNGVLVVVPAGLRPGMMMELNVDVEQQEQQQGVVQSPVLRGWMMDAELAPRQQGGDF